MSEILDKNTGLIDEAFFLRKDSAEVKEICIEYGIAFAFRAQRVILLRGTEEVFVGGPWAHFLFTGVLMRTVAANVQALIEPAIATLGYEYIGAEYLPQGKHSVLRVYIDHESGIDVEDCARVSHQIGGLLDVEDVLKGQYTLEVSSPGLDRPLFTEAHFKAYIGHEIKLVLTVPVNGQRKFQGQLIDLKDGKVTLNVDGNDIELPLINIDRANLIPVY